jgi:hypothetical protein
MHRFFQKISPPFLRRLDHQLLLNYPGLWATRIHYLLFFLSIAMGLVFLMVYATPMPFTELPDPDAMWLFFALSGLGFLLWLVQLVHFQAWKQGESRWWRSALRDQFVYALGVLLILGLPFAYFGLFQFRLGNLQSEKELLADLNTLHQGHAYLVHSGINKYFDAERDELVYINYHSSQIPGLLRAPECARIAQRSSPAERLEHLTDFVRVGQKYSFEAREGLSPSKLLASYDHEAPLEREMVDELDYIQYEAMTNLRKFQEAHYRETDWEMIREGFLPVYLSILLLVFLLVRTSWRQFLFTMAAALGLLIVEGLVVGLLMGISKPNDPQTWSLLIIIVNWALLGLFAFSGKVRNNRQQNWRTMAMGLFTILSALLPWLTLLLTDSPSYHVLIQFYNFGFLAVLVLWNLLFQRQLLRLGTNPQNS